MEQLKVVVREMASELAEEEPVVLMVLEAMEDLLKEDKVLILWEVLAEEEGEGEAQEGV